MPRIQDEAAVKLLAGDFTDEATLLESLAGLRLANGSTTSRADSPAA